MTEQTPAFEIEFYEDASGNEPAKIFMRGLSPVKRRAIGVAITEVLQHFGPDVVDVGFGKALGEGLFEFRLDQNAEQILRRKGKDPKPEPDEGKILLRVFFHAHGNKLILLLSGYDKGERTSKSHQNAEIEGARRHLKDWKEQAKRASARALGPKNRRA